MLQLGHSRTMFFFLLEHVIFFDNTIIKNFTGRK